MTGQDTAAAERSASIVREAAPAASWPVVEVAPGVWKLRAVVEMEDRVAVAEQSEAELIAACSDLDAKIEEQAEAIVALLGAIEDTEISQPGAWARLHEAKQRARAIIEPVSGA